MDRTEQIAKELSQKEVDAQLSRDLKAIEIGDYYYIEHLYVAVEDLYNYRLHIVKAQEVGPLGINQMGQMWTYTQKD